MKYLVILFLFSGTILSGCSLLGYAIGSEIDHGAAHDTVTIFHNIEDNCGQTAKIIYRDSTVADAEFIGYEDEADLSYKDRFGKFLQTDANRYGFIALSDSLIVIGDSSETSSGKAFGKFQGFLPYALRVSSRIQYFRNYYRSGSDVFPWLVPCIVLGPLPFLIARFGRNHSRQINGVHFAQTSKTLTNTDIALMIEENSVPVQSTLNFNSNGRQFSLTNSDFRNVIIMPHSAPARWIGLGIGAVIDVSGIIAALTFKDFGNTSFLKASPINFRH